MLGYATLLGGLLDDLLQLQRAHISRRIGRGQLDHVAHSAAAALDGAADRGLRAVLRLGGAAPGVVALLWAVGDLARRRHPGWLALLALNLAASVGDRALAFSYLWGSLAFWAPRAAEEISSSSLRLLDQLKPFPLDGLRPALLGGLLTVLPVGFVAWYPCRALLRWCSPDAVGAWPGGLAARLAALRFALLAAGVFRARNASYMDALARSATSAIGHRR